MFIKRNHHPWVEFNLEDRQLAPTLVHYHSDRCDPFKTVLPQLIEAAGGGEERAFIVESPLSEVLDERIALHRDPEWRDRVVVDKKHRAFFEAVKLSLGQALAKLDQIEFAALEDDEE